MRIFDDILARIRAWWQRVKFGYLTFARSRQGERFFKRLTIGGLSAVALALAAVVTLSVINAVRNGRTDPDEPQFTATQLTASPALSPSPAPTVIPTVTPTVTPSATPAVTPTAQPSATPAAMPTAAPTATPTVKPTATPRPTVKPTPRPTATPAPTPRPTAIVTPVPEPVPTLPPAPFPTNTPGGDFGVIGDTDGSGNVAAENGLGALNGL